MNKLSKFVVSRPKFIVFISLLLLIPTIIGAILTPVNYDILDYLPSKLSSAKGERILSEEFNSASMTMVITENMSSKEILNLKKEFLQIKNVDSVIWTDSFSDGNLPGEMLPDELKDIFYSKDGSFAMMYIQLENGISSRKEIKAVQQIQKIADWYPSEGQNVYVSGLTAVSGQTKSMTDRQAPVYVAIAIILAVVVMLFTMESSVIPFILVGVLSMAVVFNMGTNFIIGGVSYITQSIAAILQLAVTLDYSIFLVNRYNEEKKKTPVKEQAMEKALHGSFTSLSGSSLTTLSGFVALCFMQLKLGFNIGFVMAKGVVLGVLAVVTILPAFLLIFDAKIEKHKHKTLSLTFRGASKFVIKTRGLFAVIFVIILLPAVVLGNSVETYFNVSVIDKNSDEITAQDVLRDEFNMNSMHFIVVDDSLPTKQLSEIAARISNVDGINRVIGYNYLLGTTIPDSIVPDEVNSICKQGGYQIMLAVSDYTATTEKCDNQVEQMQSIVNEYAGEEKGTGYVTGEGALYKDLKQTTDTDFRVTNIISIIAVFIVIAVVFKSWTLPILLILSIELAIWINEGIAFLTGASVSFVAPTMITCVQLGATVDYAILLTSRFKEEISKGFNKVEAMKNAAFQSVKSIFQSAMMFFFATFGVYLVCSITIVKEICAMLARGSIISALVILLFLMPLLVITEKLIAKTTKGWNEPAPAVEGDDIEYVIPAEEKPIRITNKVKKDKKEKKDKKANKHKDKNVEFEEETFTEFSFSDDE